jgi:branched-chain amino acid transport system substrate-binding protein
MKIKCISLCSALAAVLFFSGCAKQSEADSDVIKVGQFASLTGAIASFGQSSNNGTVLAIQEMNSAGGVLGKQIELITEDDRSTAGEPANVVRKLIHRDNVVAVLGQVASSMSLEAAPVCQSAGIPMITPASTNPEVTEKGDFIFRICFIDPFQGKVMAKFSKENLGAAKAAILTDVRQDYSVGLSTFFKQTFEELGGEIVAEQSFSSGDTDFKAQLTTIRAAQPDVIFVPAYYTEAALIALQARELGIQQPLAGGDGWDSPKLFEIGGDAVNGCYFSNHYTQEDPSEAVQTFIRKYQEAYGSVPDAMAALGYDSVYVLVDAMNRAGSTEPEALRDAIAATSGFQGVTGTITLDENRNASKPAVVLKIEDGKAGYVATIDP